MSDNLKGILSVIIAMTLFSIQDTLFKVISQDASMLQIIVTRGLLGGMLIIGFMIYTKQPIRFNSAYPIRAVIRGVMFFCGFMAFYLALSLMPLAEATTLFFVSPFFISIFSVFFFKAKIGIHRIGAIICGFLGTLLVVKPNPEMFNWASLLPIFCAFCYALSMMLAKQTQEKDTSLQQTMHMYIAAVTLGTIMSLALSGSQAEWADHPDLAFMLRDWQFKWNYVLAATLVISLTASIGIVLLITAYRIAEPSLIAPFEYTVLFFAMFIGYVVFDEVIDLFSLLGMGLIVASGVYIFWREMVRNKPLAVETSLRS